MARPSTATAASTSSTFSAASTASTASQSPASLLWAHQLKREHTYLADRFRQLESKNGQVEEALRKSEEGQKELIVRLEARIDELTDANATALQACEAVRKEDHDRTNELRDEIQLLKSTIEHHGRIQTEADVQREKAMDGHIAILKRLAVFEQSAKGNAEAVIKLNDELQKACAKDAYMQEQIDLMNAMAGKDKDASQKETQRTMRELSEAIKTMQSLEARIEQLGQSVVLLAQENDAIKTRLAQQPVVTEVPAQASTSATLSSLDETMIKELDLLISTTAVHDLPAVGEETVVSFSPVHKTKASNRTEPIQKAIPARNPQKTSRVVKASTKRATASRTKNALTKKGAGPQVADPAALAQVRESVLETTSNDISKTREHDGEEVSPAPVTAVHRTIAETVKDKDTQAWDSQARPKKQKGKGAQASDPTTASASNMKRTVKRKAEIVPADQDRVNTEPRTNAEPQAESRRGRPQNEEMPEPPSKHDAHSEKRADATSDLTRPTTAAPALRRSARTQQIQVLPPLKRKAKSATAVVRPTANKPTSGRDPTTGKFTKRKPAKRLVRVSSEGSPTLIGEPEKSINTGNPKGRTDNKSAQDIKRQPAATRLPSIPPRPRSTHSANWRAPQIRYLQREISPPPKHISQTNINANAVNTGLPKGNLLPESLFHSSPPPLQSRRNLSEASTLIDRGDSIEIFAEDSLPKLPPPPPPPPPDVPRAAKRRRIDTNVDEDIEELMRLKRELMMQ